MRLPSTLLGSGILAPGSISCWWVLLLLLPLVRHSDEIRLDLTQDHQAWGRCGPSTTTTTITTTTTYSRHKRSQ
ncbi:hypothetical protein E2C01_067823 [Portunus trituberculatus]|uniref:Uncharacterized protein n=1 Tax=Portunus trituberculatus TaxID=210409 RepID=A0A5B7HKU8_PORTR|nr:hypothetical protein [Portunus trituberculatus]